VFRLDVAYVFHTHVFSWYFRRMLQVFQLFQMYVASVSSKCCKSRSNVAHVVVGPAVARPTYMCVGVEGVRAVGMRNARRRGNGAARAPREQHAYAGARAGAAGTGVRILDLPY
jgi:hypothetical protein